MANIMQVAEDGQRPAAYEEVAKKISVWIKSKDLKPMDRLPTEHELSEQLGVSRTVIREAVKVLVAIGLVSTRRGSGLYVANKVYSLADVILYSDVPVDITSVISLYEYRLTLEVSTARFAAERITFREVQILQGVVDRNLDSAEKEARQEFRESDADLHHVIAEASHNQFLASAVAMIARTQNWVFGIAAGSPKKTLQLLAAQHEAILQAIKDGKPEVAAQNMRIHLETARDNYQQEVQRNLSIGL